MSINKEKINDLLDEIRKEIFENGTDEEYNKYMARVKVLQRDIYNQSSSYVKDKRITEKSINDFVRFGI